MSSKQTIDEFLAQQHVAFVGVSRDSKQFADRQLSAVPPGGVTA